MPSSRCSEGSLGPKEKQPYRFELANGGLFAFAGLWDAWKDPAYSAHVGRDSWLQSFTVVTTDPNVLTGQVHSRMPVIIPERDYDRWLTRENYERPPVDLLRPYPAEEMEAYEVSKDVGNVRNNHPELLNSK